MSKRLAEHNEGKSRFTKALVPWKLVYVQFFATRERLWQKKEGLNDAIRSYLRWLIDQPVNKIKQI